ncbi:ChaN family lipoprotein [Pistricoccus aurantiacus]|uniref:ChaN family lipoprotein n=1 Tax=Pistricoccus aurantiacus TaxID=1883414 RepID=UPI0016492ECD|nr:ChaN family lipoprotein [Pistricoccus aurantiacus]
MKTLLALGAWGLLPQAVLGDTGPLGRVWDTRQEKWLDTQVLRERLLEASTIIVGERHDNPEHHRLERWLVNILADAGRLGGVAMEMLDAHQQTLLEAHSLDYWCSLDDDQLQKALEWQEGWDWQAYGPTVRRVLELDVPLLGANLVGDEVRGIARAGKAPALSASVAEWQRQALIEGHCGMLPEDRLDGMLGVQVARDRAMAKALAALPEIGVLICGAGHARRDVGVARYMTPKPLTLGLVELPAGMADWRQALPRSADSDPAFDLVWFTPSMQRDDPCKMLRRRFGGSSSEIDDQGSM